MEVHPPHEPVHTWREALIHIGLMTIGLFIALMLEGLVEYSHHKHLVHEARENIRHEIENNHRAAQEDVQHLNENAGKVKAGLKTMHYMHAHPQAQNQSIEFTMSFNSLSDAAYRTARDTGALGFMSYDEVQRYVAIYGYQEKLSSQAGDLLTREAETIAPILGAQDEDFGKISAAQYDEMLRSTGANLMDVQLLAQYLQSLDHLYLDVLKR